MTELLSPLMPALAGALLHFLWQGALLGLFAALVLALLRNARPQARYAVACIALLACVLWPAATLWQALAQAGDAASAATSTHVGLGIAPAANGRATGIGAALPLPAFDLQPWIVVLWAAGVGLLSLRMAGGLFWVRHLCRHAQAEADAQWQACLQRLATRMGIARKVALRIGHDGDGPVTAGWWRPLVVLPAAIVARMPAELVEALIAHELAHVRRHDYLVNLLQGAVETLLFYHPVVWWLSRRIRIERELVADDLAAAALGEPRRLALALSELDRHAGMRSLPPPSRYAPAAHGGHLMSRIRQLVRPERRAIGSAVALPLIGLAIAGAAFYAHAHLAPAQSTAATTATTHVPPPAPPPAPAAPAAAVPAPPPPPPPPPKRLTIASNDAQAGYALVRKDGDDFSVSGSNADNRDIEAAHQGIDGDFLWFRRDGKAWVVSDPATVARARQAWASTDALSEQMQGLNARMQPHSERMQALGQRMQALSADNAMETPQARAASEQMQALGEQMGELGQRQAALAGRMATASEADAARLQREQDQLSREQQALSAQMERHAAVLEAAGKRMEAQHAPMEAIGKEMDAAGKPMEAIGKEMEALGARIEHEAGIADRQVRKLIDEAYAGGRARPAPSRR